MCSAEYGREDLLGLCAAHRAVPAAAGFARDDGRSERVLGAPIGGVECGVEEEAEDGMEFGVEVNREAASIREATGPPIEQAPEAIEIGAACDGEAVIGHGAGGMAIAGGQGGAQQMIDLRRKRMMRGVQHHRATATEQMGQTGLMRGVNKLPIRRPAVALQDAGVVGAQHVRRLRKAAPVLDGVCRRGRRGKGPEPVRVAADFPAGFIGGDHRTAADLRAQGRVGRQRLPRRAMDRLDEPAARDGEAEAVTQQRHDLAEGEAELFVQDHRQGHRLRPELPGGGAERIGGLQRVTSLDASPTLRAVANGHAKLVDDRGLDGQVFLILRHHALSAETPATGRALGRQRRVMRHVDTRRPPPMRLPAVGGSRLASRRFGIRFRQPARERRGLAIGSTTRHLEFLFQPLVLAPQAIAFDLRAPQIFFEPLNAAHQIVDEFARVFGRRLVRAPRHVLVMPDPRKKYKSNHVEYAT